LNYLRHAPSPLILPDPTFIIAFPGLVFVMTFAQLFGVSEINPRHRLPAHVPAVLITAALVYLLGAAAGWLLTAAAGWLAPRPLRQRAALGGSQFFPRNFLASARRIEL
jgi:hypothetical protein